MWLSQEGCDKQIPQKGMWVNNTVWLVENDRRCYKKLIDYSNDFEKLIIYSAIIKKLMTLRLYTVQLLRS